MSDEPGADYVQPPVVHNRPILMAEPDPGWADDYAAQEARIRVALGDGVLQVEHVGSTSVPGLAAKPILDMLLLVADPTRERDYVPALEQVDYTLHLREPGWHEHRLLKHVEPAVNLHVFGSDSAEPSRMLLFRDWLRMHAEDRSLYESVKRQLAAQQWMHVQDYADAKTGVVKDILDRAVEHEETRPR